ncbi:MAG: NAD(P)H-dependent oxidoreductase subunit E [Planctomycetes bacterium]|nr:NAD(P)H-dependent oxidoreductase subunit E [Planctomycetota bacterium]
MSEIATIVDRHRGKRGDLIAILEEIQSRYSYLPEDSLREVAQRTGRSLVDIYGVATFYRWFSLEPRGKHVVTCCMGTACHVRGAPRVVEALGRRLGITAGQTTPDRNFTLETVNCLGACAMGPVVVIDGRYHPKVASSAVSALVDRTARGNGTAEGEEADGKRLVLNVRCPRCGHSLLDEQHPLEDRPSIRLEAVRDGRAGWIRLSSVYGSPRVAAESDIPSGTVVDFQCPQCHAHLADGLPCWDCGAPMFALQIVGGGTMSFCSRRGCTRHLLDVNPEPPTRPLLSER